MISLKILKDIPNYLFGIGNNYYYKLEENFHRTFFPKEKRSPEISYIEQRKRTRMVLRTFATAITSFALYKTLKTEHNSGLLFLSFSAEWLRFASFLSEQQQRKEFLEKRKEEISRLAYQPLEEICEEAELHIEERAIGYNLDKYQDDEGDDSDDDNEQACS